MRPHVSAVVCGLLLFLPRLSAQDTEVKSARISLQPRTVPIERVTIENRRSSPLIAWEIGLFAPGASQPSSAQYSDRSWPQRDDTTADGPIKPNERRIVDVDLGNRQDPRTVALRMVVFADGFYEGAPSVLAAWRERNNERADDLAYWVRALDGMPRDSALEVRRYFVDRRAERARHVKGDASGLRSRMTVLSAQQTSTLPTLLSAIDRVRADAASLLIVLRPPLTRDLPGDPSGNVTSVGISSVRSATTNYVAAIENLRNVPLEAFGFEVFEAGSERAGSGQSTDFCPNESDRVRGRGQLVSGEVRDFPFGHPVKEGDPLPSIRLNYVIFDDLSFEGSAADRDALLRRREQRAEDLAYAIAALTQAAAQPTQAEALLTAKRAERARQLQEAGRQGDLSGLDDLIRQAQTSPEQLAATASARRASLERQRDRLLRHVRR